MVAKGCPLLDGAGIDPASRDLSGRPVQLGDIYPGSTKSLRLSSKGPKTVLERSHCSFTGLCRGDPGTGYDKKMLAPVNRRYDDVWASPITRSEHPRDQKIQGSKSIAVDWRVGRQQP